MSFSMCSCRHFSDFLSDEQVRQQRVMSKRGHKTTSEDDSKTMRFDAAWQEWRHLFTNFWDLGTIWWMSMKDPKHWPWETRDCSRRSHIFSILKCVDQRMFQGQQGTSVRIKSKQTVTRQHSPNSSKDNRETWTGHVFVRIHEHGVHESWIHEQDLWGLQDKLDSLRYWKLQLILEKTFWRIPRCTRTQNSKRRKLCSILRRW